MTTSQLKDMRDAIAALEQLLRYAEGNECHHEETHRGGAIWTICDQCGRMWADDRGGFKPYEQPLTITRAQEALEKAKAIWRPKSEPKVRAWTLGDIPLGMALRHKEAPLTWYFPVCVDEAGVQIYFRSSMHFLRWDTLEEFYEYSTDRKTWHPCTVTE